MRVGGERSEKDCHIVTCHTQKLAHRPKKRDRHPHRVSVSIFILIPSEKVRSALGMRHAEGEHLTFSILKFLSAGKDFAQHVGACLKTYD